jgi:hypothetical protein
MSTTLMTLSAEAFVAVLLIVTIIYCSVLNRRLGRLRADESDLRAVIGELVTATEIAERAIGSLKETAVDCDRSLSTRMREAEHFSLQLAGEVAEGRKLLARIKQIANAVRKPDGKVAASASDADAVVTVKPEDRISTVEFEKAVTEGMEGAGSEPVDRFSVAANEVRTILPPPVPRQGNRIEELRAMAEQARERLKELRKNNSEKAA